MTKIYEESSEFEEDQDFEQLFREAEEREWLETEGLFDEIDEDEE